MDRQSLALLIPILALSIPVLAIIFNGMAKVAQARAAGGGAGQGGELGARVDALEQDLDNVRHELAETQERLDFAERLLARNAEAPRVLRPAGPQEPDPAA